MTTIRLTDEQASALAVTIEKHGEEMRAFLKQNPNVDNHAHLR